MLGDREGHDRSDQIADDKNDHAGFDREHRPFAHATQPNEQRNAATRVARAEGSKLGMRPQTEHG
jgi:hypothetical protein